MISSPRSCPTSYPSLQAAAERDSVTVDPPGNVWPEAPLFFGAIDLALASERAASCYARPE